MDRFDFYFIQPVSATEFNGAFTAAEAADWTALKDRGIFGILTGFAASAPGGGFNLSVLAGTGIDKNGARLFSNSTITLDVRTDTSGVSTLPSAGHRRWISIYARFGRNLSDPRTDGLGAAIKFNQAQALNPDDVQAHVGHLLVVQGTEDLITNPYPTRHAPDASAILLADVLLTDGDASLVDAAVDTTRAERVAVSSLWEMPSSSQFNGGAHKYVLVSSIPVNPTDGIASRMYASDRGLCITYNTFWNPVDQTWNPDFTGPASRIMFYQDGIIFDRRNDTSSAWADNTWDGNISLFAQNVNDVLHIPAGSDIVTGGTQTVLWGVQDELTATGGGLTKGSFATFPRTFLGTPSSVTASVLGSDAGSGTFTTNVRDVFPGGAFMEITGTVPTVIRCYRTIVASYP